MLKALSRKPWMRRFQIAVLGLYLRTVLRTITWEFHGMEHLAGRPAGSAVIFAAWHEHLPLTPVVWWWMTRQPGGQAQRIALLVSKSRDGALLGGLLGKFGARTIGGSSSKGGREAMHGLIDALRRGEHIGITPDGPRGPRRQAHAGAVQLAALSGAPLMPIGACVSRGHALRSWDRMVLPKPFGRGVIVCGPPLAVERAGWRQATAALEQALDAASEQARARLRA